MNKLVRYFEKNIIRLGLRGFLTWIPDPEYLKILYHYRMGTRLDLKSPKAFNEKIQWLKLYDRNESYHRLVDKYNAKEYVAKLIGNEYVVPCYGVWQRFENIDFSLLPQQFVLKCTHDQGSAIIIKDKNALDTNLLKKHFKKCLRNNMYTKYREWAYKGVVPRILCEQYLGENLIDYKFFCFNGEPLFVNIGSHIDGQTQITFYSLERWEPEKFQRSDFGRVDMTIQKPENIAEMLRIARLLSKDVPFVRIDLFSIRGKTYFSEFTLYPTAGFIMFEPRDYDYILGAELDTNVVRFPKNGCAGF